MAKKNKETGEGTGTELSKKARNRAYEAEIAKLQVEIAHLQAWVKESGARIVIIFEGRDAAGKGGVIKRLIERVSPRASAWWRCPLLPIVRRASCICSATSRNCRPPERSSSSTAAGTTGPASSVSWGSARRIRRDASSSSSPRFEAAIVEGGVQILKYFLDVSEEEQERRFRQRIDDPVRQWKLSPMDVEMLPPLVGLHPRLRRDDPGDRHAGTRRGGSCPRTTRSGRASTASPTS